LCRGKIAGGQHHKAALTFNAKTIHLAIGADLIDTGIGSGVRTKYQAGINGNNSKTVRHNSPNIRWRLADYLAQKGVKYTIQRIGCGKS
jgi:hypothetical protein